MTHLTVRDYSPEDFMSIECAEPTRLWREGQDKEAWAEIHKGAGPSATVVDPEGWIVFCCGIDEFWPGVGDLWAVFSPLARKYLETMPIARTMLRYYMLAYRRLQAAVDPEWRGVVQFVERLGFEREGIARALGPQGKDMAMYAFVREEN